MIPLTLTWDPSKSCGDVCMSCRYLKILDDLLETPSRSHVWGNGLPSWDPVLQDEVRGAGAPRGRIEMSNESRVKVALAFLTLVL